MRTVAGAGPIPAERATDAVVVSNAAGEYAVTTETVMFVAVQSVANEHYMVARRPAGARAGLARTVLAGIRLGK